jgi:hypothetical protein
LIGLRVASQTRVELVAGVEPFVLFVFFLTRIESIVTARVGQARQLAGEAIDLTQAAAARSGVRPLVGDDPRVLEAEAGCVIAALERGLAGDAPVATLFVAT